MSAMLPPIADPTTLFGEPKGEPMSAERKPEVTRGSHGFSQLWIAMPIISLVVGPITFIIGWVYAISEFGFFLGVGMGWIPALFIGYFAALLTKLIMMAFVLAFAMKPMREVSLANPAHSNETSPRKTEPRGPKMSLESRVKHESTKEVWAYLLWGFGFVGLFGLHRFYLTRHATAFSQFWLALVGMSLSHNPLSPETSLNAGPSGDVSNVFALAFVSVVVWQTVDAFLIPGMIRERQAVTRKRIIDEMAAAKRKALTSA